MEQVEKKNGRLVIVGSGIKGMSQITLEAKGWIETAEKLFYLVSEPVTQSWIKRIRPDGVNLHHLYSGKKMRMETYRDMRDLILASVREGKTVCAVFYGHPGVFALPPHASIRMARAEGYQAEMLAGVSAEDCLFADLGIDPSSHGLQSFEATELLLSNRDLNTSTHVAIWQVGVVGDPGFDPSGNFSNKNTSLLREYLSKFYGENYFVYDYLGSSFAHIDPQIYKIKIGDIGSHIFHVNSTLYIPPKDKKIDPGVLKILGLDEEGIKLKKEYAEKRIPEGRPDSQLAQFLERVAFQPHLLDEFKNDPHGFQAKYAISFSENECLAILNGDRNLTYSEIMSEK